MKKIQFAFFAVLAACLLSGCNDTKDSEGHEAYVINTFEDNPYLAEIWWGEDYDEATAAELIKQQMHKADSMAIAAAKEAGGGCSSWHKDNFHGRNIDWNMRDFATLVIHMPKNEAKGVKYASVSLIAGAPFATKDFIHDNKTIPEKFHSMIPAAVVDGMNECGVVINHNIVPYLGKEYVRKGDFASTMVCRYVLDHCASAKEAVDSLRNKPVAQSLITMAHDYSHFMISDSTSTYVVEWIDGNFVATEFKADGKGNYISPEDEPAIMTNYFVGRAEQYGLGSKEFFLHHPNAAGVERTLIIANQLPQAKTLEDHLNICKSVWYRQFCQGKTQWYTENAGQYGYDTEKGKAWWQYPGKEKHWMDNDDVYAAGKALLKSPDMQEYYKDFNANWDKCDAKNTYWYTQHSVVYDIKALKGYLIMQEGMFSNKTIELSIK